MTINTVSAEYALSLLASATDAIIGYTLDGVITSWNDGAERLYGYQADKIIGQSITQLLPSAKQSQTPSLLKKNTFRYCGRQS